jgi:hypothetical protein
MGVTEEEAIELFNFFEKNKENIKSEEDFMNGITQAMTMIAYGYPELIDPTPGDMLMFHLAEFKK